MVHSLKHNTSIINKQNNGDNKIIIHSFLLVHKKYWVKIRKCAQKLLSSGLKGSFKKGAANCQRAAVSFAGKRRLVSSEQQVMMSTRKYAWNTNTNTQNTHRKTRYTKIQVSLFAFSARSEENKNEIFWEKKCSHENGRNFGSRIISKGPRVPKRTYSTGLSIPKKDGVSQKSFYGGKSGQKL